VVTGKPVTIGGSSGRMEATGRGILYIAQEACRHYDIDLRGATVAVQGFGNVGSVAAKLLDDAGAKVVAVSDSTTAIHHESGLDIDVLLALKHDQGFIPAGHPGKHITNDELLELPVDILVPAAIEGQIDGSNAARVRARLIIEAANGPITPEADRILTSKGVKIVPDIVANSGGVIVSYFEWVQDLQSFFWEEDEVDSRLEQLITRSFREVAAIEKEEGGTMREAAYMLAVRRVVEATQVRGIFP
jgi:glutamate dehydrogenase (NAD(P)+)